MYGESNQSEEIEAGEQSRASKEAGEASAPDRASDRAAI
jgi:hypothetical protein